MKIKEKNKKTLIVLIAILAFLAAVFFFVNQKFIYKTTPDNRTTPDNQLLSQPVSQENNKNNSSAENPSDIITITGQLKAVSLNSVKISIGGAAGGKEEELTINISLEKGANFYESIKKKKGGFINKKVGLLDLPLNKEATIAYNKKTNELKAILIILNE